MHLRHPEKTSSSRLFDEVRDSLRERRILISSEHLFFYLGYVCVKRETCKTKYKRKRKGVPNNQSNFTHKFLQFLLTQLKSLIYYLYFTLYYFEDRRVFILFYLGR